MCAFMFLGFHTCTRFCICVGFCLFCFLSFVRRLLIERLLSCWVYLVSFFPVEFFLWCLSCDNRDKNCTENDLSVRFSMASRRPTFLFERADCMGAKSFPFLLKSLLNDSSLLRSILKRFNCVP